MIINFNLPDNQVVCKNYNIIPKKGEDVVLNFQIYKVSDIVWCLEKDIINIYCTEKDY